MGQQVTPTIWMNVTTSANWSRPPVGIVRVEQALCDELETLLGKDRFKRCVWHDGKFLEWNSVKFARSSASEDAIDLILPPTQSFDFARQYLRRAIAIFGDSQQHEESIALTIPLTSQIKLTPQAGDILISIGLDWDQSYTPEFYKLAKSNGIKIITCCYDLIPVLFPQYCVGDVAERFKEYFNLLTWGSSAVLCISEQTKRDYLDLGEKIASPKRPAHVIPLGDNVPSGKGKIGKDVETVLEDPFILFVSTIERRKNHEVLYRAYHQLCRSGHREKLPKLVFVGMPGWGVSELLKDIELDPITMGLIVQLNHVTDFELKSLYRKALFCAFPSLYEGWGLPVGEALAMGKAVLCSNQGSLPEVGGDLVRYLPPWHVQAWADAILEWSTDDTLIQSIEQRVSKTYKVRTWSATAQAVKDVIFDVLNEGKDAPITIYPGYDCSTQVGMHFGASLLGTGRPGFLMFGPHRAIAPGRYRVGIYGILQAGVASRLEFDFVAKGGDLCLWKGDVQTALLPHSIETELLNFTIEVRQHLEDFEIRCIDTGAEHQLTRVEVQKQVT